MRTRLLLLLAGTILAAGFAPAPPPRPGKNLLATLQGTWEVASVEWVGVRKGPSPTIAHVKIEGKHWTTVFKRPDGKFQGVSPSTAYELKLDSSKSPPQMDLKHKGSGPTLTGILEVKGDTVTFGYAFDPPGQAKRPASFDKMAKGQIVMTFKRVKR